MAKKVTDKKAPVKKVAPKKEAVKLDPIKVYEFVVTKESKHMKPGSYFMDGSMAELLTLRGYGNVKS